MTAREELVRAIRAELDDPYWADFDNPHVQQLLDRARAVIDRELPPDSETEWGCRDRHGQVHSVGVETEAQARAMRSMTPVCREVGPWTEVQP
jgi:hypothetical protein